MTEEKRRRGFASMDPEKQRALASLGGKAVPAASRQFSDLAKAAAAGRKGGKARPAGDRAFSKDRALAVEAGRKGGLATGAKRKRLENV